MRNATHTSSFQTTCPGNSLLIIFVTRLAIVTGPDTSPTSDVLTISQFLSSQRHRSTTWTHAVSRIYLQAARRNLLLCGGLLAYLSDPAYPACGQ